MLVIAGRQFKLRRVVLIATLVGMILFAWIFARELRLILSHRSTLWTQDVTADCAVVLTGGPNRIREGFDLLARKSVQKLIISGVHPHAELREIFPLWPYYGDLRERDVILDRRSRTTYGNAQQTLPLVEALQCRDLVLITSHVHMYRSLQTFRAEFPTGFTIVPHAVYSSSVRPDLDELFMEAMKSIFYSLWAY